MPAGAISAWTSGVQAGRRWAERLGKFAAGQAMSQVLAFVTALLVLRWMSETEYAKAGIVLGFQALFTAFVDLGLAGSLVALAGRDGRGPRELGRLVAAARWWRLRLLLVVLPAGAVAFHLVASRQQWSPTETAVLYGGVVLAVCIAGLIAWTSAPLLIHQRLGMLYAGANAGGLIRLGGCFALHQGGQLDAIGATGIGVLAMAVTAAMYWATARRYIDEPAIAPTEDRRRLRQHVAPLVPLAIFTPLQGQVATLAIAWFGQAQGIAELTALGRLGQLFAFATALFGMLVMPSFARMDDATFRRRYVAITAATLVFTVTVSGLAFAWPEPLLWLLGHRYAHLGDEVGWMVLASALSFAGGAIWTVHFSRRWIFWRATAAHIAVVTATQLACLHALDLSRTHGVVLLAAATGLAALLMQCVVAWLGFRRDASRSADAGDSR